MAKKRMEKTEKKKEQRNEDHTETEYHLAFINNVDDSEMEIVPENNEKESEKKKSFMKKGKLREKR